jgi:hypothetical protein
MAASAAARAVPVVAGLRDGGELIWQEVVSSLVTISPHQTKRH